MTKVREIKKNSKLDSDFFSGRKGDQERGLSSKPCG